MNRGALAILAILLLAGLLSGFAWWHSYQRGKRSLALWGEEAAVLIRYAPRVEFVPLEPGETGTQAEAAAAAGQAGTPPGGFGTAVDITDRRGLIHARHALVEDASYVWERAAGATDREWTFALRFRDGEQQATLAFDTHGGHVRRLEDGREARLTAALRDAFAGKARQWGGDTATSAP